VIEFVANYIANPHATSIPHKLMAPKLQARADAALAVVRGHEPQVIRSNAIVKVQVSIPEMTRISDGGRCWSRVIIPRHNEHKATVSLQLKIALIVQIERATGHLKPVHFE
jgi:hypothetical protein